MSDIRMSARNMFESLHRIEVEVLEDGTLPYKAHASDAGFDLFATEDVTIYPGQIVKHPLNIKMKLPVGSWGRVETKSGLGSKGMLVFAGVIDREYRGIPHVIMTNLNSYDRTTGIDDDGVPHALPVPIEIKKGQKIAQMTMNAHSEGFYIKQVEAVSEDTTRGTGGFGSSGE